MNKIDKIGNTNKIDKYKKKYLVMIPQANSKYCITSSNILKHRLHVWMKGMMTEVTREMMSPGAMLGPRSYHPDATPDSSLHKSNNLVFIFI